MADVQSLIDHWQQVRNMASRYKAGNQAVSELTKLGEQKEVWQVFACLIGYSQQEQKNMKQILAQIPDGIPANQSAWNASPFLLYCRAFERAPIEEFLPAVYFTKAQMNSMTILACSVITIERCLNSSGGDPEKFLRCISQAENQQQAASAGAQQ